MVLPPSACPFSNCPDPIIANLNAIYLDTATSKRAIRPLDLERLRKERQQGGNYIGRAQKREGLSPLGGCPIPGPKENTSGGSLSTSLSLSLASTSRVDRVDLYGLIEMA
jgi:hypothetical protein